MPCEDAPCCGCCGPENDYVSPELAEEMDEAEMYPDDEPWDGFQTDAEADADVLALAGYGTEEDYGMYEDASCEGYDEH